MTLDTTVRIPGPVNMVDLLNYCAAQLGIPIDAAWCEQSSDVLDGHVLLTPAERDFGGAHLSILYRQGEARMGREVLVTWITGWGSRSPLGESPVTFHRRLSRELCAWLVERGQSGDVEWDPCAVEVHHD